MSSVSTTTVREATQTISALEAKGIEVAGVEFDHDADTFSVRLGSGGRVGPSQVGGGTIKREDTDEEDDFDTTQAGGGTIKADE